MAIGRTFRIREWIGGETLTLVRNENYWKLGRPYLDSVTWVFVGSDELAESFANRDFDVVSIALLDDAAGDLEAAAATAGASVTAVENGIWEHINFQFGPGALDRNPNSTNEYLTYRTAVAHALDRELIASEVQGGYATPLDSVFALSSVPSVVSWADYEHDPVAAAALAADAAAQAGQAVTATVFSTTSNVDDRVRLAELLVDMFGDAGMEYENQLEDSQLFFGETLDNGAWDLGSWAWVLEPGVSSAAQMLDVFNPAAPPPDGVNYYRWGTPDSSVINAATARFAEIVEELETEHDVDRATTLIAEAEQILFDELVIIPLYQRRNLVAIWDDALQGVNPRQDGSLTWNIEDWYVPTP